MNNEHLYIISFVTCRKKEPEPTQNFSAPAPAQILNRLRLQAKTPWLRLRNTASITFESFWFVVNLSYR